MMGIKIPCSCLVDQNRFVGYDPLGYACTNDAVKYTMVDNTYFYFCQHCLDLLVKEPERITYGSSISPEGFREEFNKFLLKNLK